MSVANFTRAQVFSLKDHPNLNERWLHRQLHEDPSLLGLGDLQVIESERRQPPGGRLDLLLRDPETLARYEVEIQLGATDETHLVRTIEYWDIERRRYPQYEHTAVIVAEDITSRFLNVISLFNGFIPLIAIQLKGVQVGDVFTLVPTKVLDVMSLGTDEDDEGEISNRAFWERKTSDVSLSLVDSLVAMAREYAPNIGPNFTKNYIGLAIPGGSVENFIIFVPKQSHVIAQFKIPQSDILSSKIEASGLALLAYRKQSGRYRVQVRTADLKDHDRKKLVADLIRMAHETYTGEP